MTKFFANLSSSWTLPGGLSAADDDDQRRLEDFLRTNPDFRAAALKAIENAASLVHVPSADYEPAERARKVAALQAQVPSPPSHSVLPKAPARISELLAEFQSRRRAKTLAVGTTSSQVSAVENFCKFIAANHPTLGADPFAHDIHAHHISAFLDAEEGRPGKGLNEKGDRLPIKAATLEKRMLDLGVFFKFVCRQKSACDSNPIDDLSDRLQELGDEASAEKESYLPFTRSEIATIFAPEPFLVNNSKADLFWCPLISGHLGLRLAEAVLLRVEDVGRDRHGIWYVSVRADIAKNKNSVRSVPITEPLIELGFLEYVDHVRRLGATHLWPHRNLTTPTALKQPTKHQSDKFGHYLTKRAIVSPRLVFHSFRHTVVTALLDGGTPVHLSMQLCGHEAQQEAIERGLLSASAARSVHLTDYSHPDVERLSNESPLLPMKRALEACVKLPLDYPRLRTAAGIVRDHTKKVAGEFVSGWPVLNSRYTAMQVQTLALPAAVDDAAGHGAIPSDMKPLAGTTTSSPAQPD